MILVATPLKAWGCTGRKTQHLKPVKRSILVQGLPAGRGQRGAGKSGPCTGFANPHHSMTPWATPPLRPHGQAPQLGDLFLRCPPQLPPTCTLSLLVTRALQSGVDPHVRTGRVGEHGNPSEKKRKEEHPRLTLNFVSVTPSPYTLSLVSSSSL